MQDLAKVKKHALRHNIDSYVCSVCNREFDSHRKLNGHMLSHRRQKRMLEMMNGNSNNGEANQPSIVVGQLPSEKGDDDAERTNEETLAEARAE